VAVAEDDDESDARKTSVSGGGAGAVCSLASPTTINPDFIG
jgi:hypothetical protein